VNHRRAIAFRWARLPYGVWQTASGIEVTFNRRYQPLYARLAGEPAAAVDSGGWIGDIVLTTFLYRDGTPEAEKRASGVRLLVAWGIQPPRETLRRSTVDRFAAPVSPDVPGA
jgi:hypothetical protein